MQFLFQQYLLKQYMQSFSNIKLCLLGTVFYFSNNTLFAQNLNYSQIENNLKKHISFLSDDKLEGRLVGSKGEKIAADYISKEFKKNKITPKGTQGYLQPFSVKKNIVNPHGSDTDAHAVTIVGNNIVGFIDNKAPYTVVIGAHYDHLGYNEFGSSTYRSENPNEKPQIHNGADDNASGTAALIELSRLLKNSSFKKNNYLFLAFSGEEEGLLGSNYYTKNPTLDTSTFTYMINMDMVGRLDTIKHSFVISGTGTSPIWNTTLKNVPSNLKVKFDESGTGASDHTSFYYINIPALHFFTGSHFDYHKPSDDADKINYKGTVQIIDYIYNLVGSLDNSGKLKFTPTAQDTTAKVRFKVTLGVMPDYLYDGKGLKVDGVTTGKPAQIAGVKRGDLIIKLGDTIVQDMQSYMKSLSQFNKGDETKVVVVRDGKELELPIKF